MSLNDLVFLISKDYVKIISSDRFGNGIKTILMAYYNYQFNKNLWESISICTKKASRNHHRNQETHLLRK